MAPRRRSAFSVNRSPDDRTAPVSATRRSFTPVQARRNEWRFARTFVAIHQEGSIAELSIFSGSQAPSTEPYPRLQKPTHPRPSGTTLIIGVWSATRQLAQISTLKSLVPTLPTCRMTPELRECNFRILFDIRMRLWVIPRGGSLSSS